MSNAELDDDGLYPESPRPKTQTSADGDSGGRARTRVGGGDAGDSGDSGGAHNFRKFGSFNPRSDVPEGAEFVAQMNALFPKLSPTMSKQIKNMSDFKNLPEADEQRMLERLRENSSAGDALYTLYSRSERWRAWIVKDFALDLASTCKQSYAPELASLVFAELCAEAHEAFAKHVHECHKFDEFIAIIIDAMPGPYNRFLSLGSSEKLYKVLKYRSVENELMQHREEKLADEEMADAISVSVEELKRIKMWNQEFLGKTL